VNLVKKGRARTPTKKTVMTNSLRKHPSRKKGTSKPKHAARKNPNPWLKTNSLERTQSHQLVVAGVKWKQMKSEGGMLAGAGIAYLSQGR